MMAVVWLGLMVAFLLIEAGTVALVSLWFAAGCLAAILVSLLNVALFFLLTNQRPKNRNIYNMRDFR